MGELTWMRDATGIVGVAAALSCAACAGSGEASGGHPGAGLDGSAESGTDAGRPDSGLPDAGADSGLPDAGTDSGLPDAGNTIALAMNESGDVIAGASFGALVASPDGVASGDLVPAPSGWVRVSAPGYVDGYAAVGARFRQKAILLATLAPLGPAAEAGPSKAGHIVLGPPGDPELDVTIPAGTLVSDAIVEVASFAPDVLGAAAYAPPPAPGLKLERALWIGATSTADPTTPVPIAGGQSVSFVVVHDQAMAAVPVLASFDAEQGGWTAVADACTRLDSTHVTCTTPHLSLFALFGEADGGGSGDALRLAWARYFAARATWDGSLPAPASVTGALGDLAAAAGSYAAGHHTESGKLQLLKVAGEAAAAGQQAVADPLMQQAQDITREMVDKALNAPCNRIYESMHVVEEAVLLGLGPDDPLARLQDKLTKDLSECEVWFGTVVYHSYELAPEHPAMGGLVQKSVEGSYVDEHDIEILGDPKTGILKGEDRLVVTLPRVNYRLDLQDTCGDNYQDYSYFPEIGGSIFVGIEGGYDDSGVRIGSLALLPDLTKSVRLRTTMNTVSWSDATGTCEKNEHAMTLTAVPDYWTFVHAFFDETVLEHCMNSPGYEALPRQIVHSGVEIVTFPASTNALTWPLETAWLHWHISHFAPKAP